MATQPWRIMHDFRLKSGIFIVMSSKKLPKESCNCLASLRKRARRRKRTTKRSDTFEDTCIWGSDSAKPPLHLFLLRCSSGVRLGSTKYFPPRCFRKRPHVVLVWILPVTAGNGAHGAGSEMVAAAAPFMVHANRNTGRWVPGKLRLVCQCCA